MANDNWQTPPEVFAFLDNTYHFKADMASSKGNALCQRFYTKKDDSLSFAWHKKKKLKGGCVWVNPPYSNPLPWVLKAIEEAKRGVSSVMLLNMDSSTEWFLYAQESCTWLSFLIGNCSGGRYHTGRIAFVDRKSGVTQGGKQPQVLCGFMPKNPESLPLFLPTALMMEEGKALLNLQRDLKR